MLSCLVVCGWLLGVGCARHRAIAGSAYKVVDENGVPMLLPPTIMPSGSEQFQKTTIAIPAGNRSSRECQIEGPVFSIHSDGRSWVVLSPSAAGWDSVGGQLSNDEQWRKFLVDLAGMEGQGCFSAAVTAEVLRTSIAKSIALPASDVVRYTYSDQGDRFVDLAADMQIQIQRLSPLAAKGKAARTGQPELWTATYDVVQERGGGVRLKRERVAGIRRTQAGFADGELLVLDQRFAATPRLRLFLQGFSAAESEPGALLIGAASATQLETMTDRIRHTASQKCAALAQPACIELPPDSTSLFSIVWVNGGRRTSSFGTWLASIFEGLPLNQQAGALQSAEVTRQLYSGNIAPIEFTRTMEGAREVLLLPGDRIRWRTLQH